MDNLPEINYRGLEEYIKNFSLKKELNEFNELIMKINNENVPIRLIPPHEIKCKECSKMAIYVIKKNNLCWWHYYIEYE